MDKLAPKPFKPMLSATCESIDAVRYPALVSPKLDGIRCILRNGTAVSRNLKPIPNAYIQNMLKGLPDGLDGELICGDPVGHDVWNRSNSGVMSRDGEPHFTFWVFDDCSDPTLPFVHRYRVVSGIRLTNNNFVRAVPHDHIGDIDALAKIEDRYVSEGYEGVMIRHLEGTYKYGRSTLKEKGLMKLKRWHDAEAIIVDMVERMHNGNEATKDELGHTKRSTHKANKVGRGDLGALVCKAHPPLDGDARDTTFELGTGFNDTMRAEVWSNRADYIGKVVTFKYQALTPDGIPRFPVFLRFRPEGS